MPHPNLLNIEKTVLVIIDLQEAFRHPINEFAQIVERVNMTVRGFLRLGLPIVVTEQYPDGLGRTADEILLTLPDDFEFIEKTSFSAGSAISEKLREAGADQIVLCGLETHVCINQTAHDLLGEGFQVHLLVDAVGSRFSLDKETGLEKMASAGVIPTSVEMALFELMKDARHPHFKEIQSLIK